MKNSKIHVPIMMGAKIKFEAKNLQKATSFLKREYFAANLLFS
jgi:hypothetical protein